MPYLIQLSGSGRAVKQWDVSGSPLSVGRGDEVHVKIDDEAMSRQHFVIEPLSPSSYRVRDLNSSNGTYLNGSRVVESPLKSGDRVKAGNTLFCFEDGTNTVMSRIQEEGKAFQTIVRAAAQAHSPTRRE
jgi:pSer/pThr/pTyr-binding forkhead associated (FHA) protein